MQADRIRAYATYVRCAIGHLASIAKEDFGMTGDSTLDREITQAVAALRRAQKRLNDLHALSQRVSS